MPASALLQLPRAKARTWVPEACALGDWTQLLPLFRTLQAAAPKLRSARALERWVFDAGELAAALDEEGARRYIRMTCQTDDPEAERDYVHFIEQIEPQAKPEWQKLHELFLACPHHAKLPQRRWRVFERETRKNVELFRPENVPLQTEEAKLEQAYQKRMGAMTVSFRGQEHTLQQMSKYLEEADRPVREEAWKLMLARRLQDKDKLEDLYDELLKLRARMAAHAGFADYRDYAFKAKGRFDYGPQACMDFHQAVEELVVPLARKLQKRRRRLLGVKILRPWDLNVDPLNRPPLRPFESVETLVAKAHEIFSRIHPALGQDFELLRRHELLDLDSRKGKAPGGYQCSLEESRLPFIFMNAVGLQRDVETLLHEGGHAFHALATRDEPLLMYRQAPLEFCEVASMSMELLAAPHLETFYAPADAGRARRALLEGIVGLFPWIATIDAFQHWIYTHPGHTREERRNTWDGLLRRFGGIEDWSGFEAARAHLWHRQPHLFTSPFYYIEYGIAQLGALQVWRKSKKDLARTVERYRQALALGRSRPLPELFKAAGLKFDFSAATVRPLVKLLGTALRELEGA